MKEMLKTFSMKPVKEYADFLTTKSIPNRMRLTSLSENVHLLEKVNRLGLTESCCKLLLGFGDRCADAFFCEVRLNPEGKITVYYDAEVSLVILDKRFWSPLFCIPPTARNRRLLVHEIDAETLYLDCDRIVDYAENLLFDNLEQDAAYDAECANEKDDIKAKELYERKCHEKNDVIVLPLVSRDADDIYNMIGAVTRRPAKYRISNDDTSYVTMGWTYWQRYRDAERAIKNFGYASRSHQASLSWLLEVFKQPPSMAILIEIEGLQAERRELRRKNRQKRNIKNDVSVDPKKLLRDQRAAIEHRLVVEAREEDEALVANLVDKERRRRIAAARLEGKNTEDDNVCGVHNMSHKPKPVHRLSTRSAVAEAKRQVKTEEHKLALLKQKELMRKKQASEAALVAEMEKNLNIGRAILSGK